jgi:hypothetical protein
VALWHSVRRELAGALRSARYDVERHRQTRRAVHLATAETNELARGYATPTRVPRRPSPRPQAPRRMMAGAGVGLLVAGGAAGTYLAVAGSLSALRADPSPMEPAVAAPAVPTNPAPVLPDEHLVTFPPAAPRHATAPRHAAPRSTPTQPVQVVIADGDRTAVPTHDPEGTPTPSASAAPSPSASDSPSPTVSSSPDVQSTPARAGQFTRTRAGQSGSGR